MEIKRKVFFETEFRKKINDGVNKLADAVKSTMGPKGRLVLIEKENQHPIVTKDGVTVANHIFLEDPIENLGAKIIKQSHRFWITITNTVGPNHSNGV